MRIKSGDRDPHIAVSISGRVNSRVAGLLVGIALAATSAVVFYKESFSGYSESVEGEEGDAPALALLTMGVGYLIGFLLKGRLPTRHLGQGILIGLTVGAPVAWAIAIAVFLSKL